MTGDDSELSVLVVDDDAAILRTLLLTLKSLGCRAVGESGGEAALAAVEKQAPDLLLTDMRMEGMSGVELTAAALERRPDLICVLMTAFASYENAVEAIKAGAYDYLPKPFSAGELEHLLRRVGDLVRLRRENTRLRQARHGWFEGLTSPAALDLQRLMDKLAQSDVSVLFQGETGTGKTSLARELHRCSARSDKPFVEVVCSAIAEPLFESEVFGHVRGAFTGAVRDRAGKFEAAERARSFWTRWASSRLPARPSCCVFWKTGSLSGWGTTSPCAWTCGCWRPPTGICEVWWLKGASVRISITA